MRDVDLAEGMWQARYGWSNQPFEQLVFVRLALAEVVARTRLARPTWRWLLDGLGWHESARFVSPSTGRVFAANAFVDGPTRRDVSRVVEIVTPDLARHAEALEDLFETLAIDLDDVELLLPPPMGFVARCCELMRVDDGGSEFRVATFSGYAKARASRRVRSAVAQADVLDPGVLVAPAPPPYATRAGCCAQSRVQAGSAIRRVPRPKADSTAR